MLDGECLLSSPTESVSVFVAYGEALDDSPDEPANGAGLEWEVPPPGYFPRDEGRARAHIDDPGSAQRLTGALWSESAFLTVSGSPAGVGSLARVAGAAGLALGWFWISPGLLISWTSPSTW
jgi:hypothetical protein